MSESLSILIVDDAEADRELFRTLLSRHDSNVTVDCASRLSDAATMVEGCAYDAIVVDLHLPEGSCGDLEKRIREISGAAPIYLHSGQRPHDLEELVEILGASGFLMKAEFDAGAFLRELTG